jgi:hypothetical protein
VIDSFSMMHGRTYGALLLVGCLSVPPVGLAQAPLGGSQNDNLGTWKWGKQPAPPPKEEAEETEETDDAADQERGSTSWERMNAEREPEQEQEEDKTMTPLDFWRALREKFK